jgi:hypothetical protein
MQSASTSAAAFNGDAPFNGAAAFNHDTAGPDVISEVSAECSEVIKLAEA